MKVLFVHDARYMEKNGAVYTELEFSYESWKPYLQHFDELRVIGRSYKPDNEIYKNAEKYNLCSGPNVSFSLYPRLTTPRNFLLLRGDVQKKIEADVARADAVILRGAQENAYLAFVAAQKLGKPVAVEGTGCMWNNSWHYGSWLAKLYAPLSFCQARKVYNGADAVLYVTENFLQKRYPTKGLSMHASDVKLSPPRDEILEARQRRISEMPPNAPLKFGLIGPVNHAQKGIDNAIKALAGWHKATGRDFELHLLGRGEPDAMRALAASLGVQEKVFCDGLLPQGAVKNWLDGLDIYLQPSRTEGLPRAALEAMSRALPVITSNAGDLPSLIDPAFVHGHQDAQGLQTLIAKLAGDKTLMKEQAARNFEKIRADFHPDSLRQKRDAFWEKFVSMVRLVQDKRKGLA